MSTGRAQAKLAGVRKPRQLTASSDYDAAVLELTAM